jgi:ankyrin repeat protein
LRDNQHGRTPLAWAIQQGHISVTRLLVGTGNADVNAKDNEERTPLLLACGTRQEDISLLLLQNGADPMYKSPRGQSALFEAASQGLPKIVDWILQSLPDEALEQISEQYDTSGKSILNIAVLSGNGSQYPIVKMVIDALAPFPDQRRKLLYY